MSRVIRLLFDSFANDPALDTAVSRAILLGVDEGTQPESLRIHRPSRVVAFGRQDTLSPGYPGAVHAARLVGFAPIERLAGGRAAIFHPATIAFAWATPERSPKEGITARFLELGDIMVAALASLGVDAAVGEIPGEYCPGAYSVHARSGHKLVGTGQRLTRRAAHVGGVVVVDDRALVNDTLGPVYQALDIDWDPAVTGDIVAAAPGVTWSEVRDAIVAAFADRYELSEGSVDAETVRRAEALAPEHVPARP